MSLIFLEAFEEVTKFQFGSTSGGRTGNGGVPSNDGSSIGMWFFPTADHHVTMVFGFAFRHGSSTGSETSILTLRSETGALIGSLRSFPLTNGRGLRWIRLRDGVELITTGTAPITEQNSYYYIEVKIVLGGSSTGFIEIRTNEVSRVSAIADTLPSSGTKIARFDFASSNGSFIVDDFYVCNGAGAIRNNYLGDVEVYRRFPTGDAAVAWMGSDGNQIDNWALVNNTSQTTYVESATVGATDFYLVGDLPGAPVAGRAVYGVHTWMGAHATVLPRGVAPVSRIGATEAEGPTYALTAGGLWYTHRQEEKPGGGAWSTADVNDLQVGVRVKS